MARGSRFHVASAVAGGSLGPVPIPELVALLGLAGGLLFSGTLIVGHLFDASYHGEGAVAMWAAAASFLFVLGFLKLKNAAIRRWPQEADLRGALGLLCLPVLIIAGFTFSYTSKILTGDVTLVKVVGAGGTEVFEDLTIIPAAIAGWIGLFSLAFLVLRARTGN